MRGVRYLGESGPRENQHHRLNSTWALIGIDPGASSLGQRRLDRMGFRLRLTQRQFRYARLRCVGTNRPSRRVPQRQLHVERRTGQRPVIQSCD
jgi:hypothetical protein